MITSLKKWINGLSIFITIILTHFVKCRRTLLELNSKVPSSERERKVPSGLFTSSIKPEIRPCCTCKVVVLPMRPIAVLTYRLSSPSPSPSLHLKVPIAAKCVVKRCCAFYHPRSNLSYNKSSCCMLHKHWPQVGWNHAGVMPYTGFTSLAAKLVCIGPVKREISTYYVTKSRTSLYFRNSFRNLRQPDLLQDRFERGW